MHWLNEWGNFEVKSLMVSEFRRVFDVGADHCHSEANVQPLEISISSLTGKATSCTLPAHISKPGM